MSMMAIRKKAMQSLNYLSPTPGPSSPMAHWPSEMFTEVGDIMLDITYFYNYFILFLNSNNDFILMLNYFF